MVTFCVSLCNQPFNGVSLGGLLEISRRGLHFHRSMWRFPQIDIIVNYRDIAAVYPCTHLLIIPAVEIHLVCGTTYKFQSVFERGYIVEAIQYMMR